MLAWLVLGPHEEAGKECERLPLEEEEKEEEEEEEGEEEEGEGGRRRRNAPMPFTFCPLREGLRGRTVLASRSFLRGGGSAGGQVPIPQTLGGHREPASLSSSLTSHLVSWFTVSHTLSGDTCSR